MKMDIEGHELFALRGANGAQARGIIKALSFGFGSGNINSRIFFAITGTCLQDSIMIFIQCSRGGKLMPIIRYEEELEYFRGVSNYIATISGGNRKIIGKLPECPVPDL